MSKEFQYKEIDNLKHLIKTWERYTGDTLRQQRILVRLMMNDKPLLQEWLDYRRLNKMLVGDDGTGDEKLEMSTRMTIVSRSSASSGGSSGKEKTLNEREAESQIDSMDDEEVEKMLEDMKSAMKKMPVVKHEKNRNAKNS